MLSYAGFVQALEDSLFSIGLTHKQALVYVALCSLGEATAYKIAEESGVKKPTAYVVLEELRKKGLVLKTPHAKKQVFCPRSIEEYLSARERELAGMRKLIPHLTGLSAKRSQVLFFSGLSGIKDSLSYRLSAFRGTHFDSLYGNLAGVDEQIKLLYEKWDQQAAQLNVSFRIVLPSKDAEKYYSQMRRSGVEIRHVKGYEYPSETSIDIGPDFVRIISATQLHATVIEDRQTAEAMRQIFKIVWEKGK